LLGGIEVTTSVTTVVASGDDEREERRRPGVKFGSEVKSGIDFS
jgi:hypothetical protein